MTPKEQYAKFCQAHPDMPIMMQPWWLEAVCAGKEWDVMLFTRNDLAEQSWWNKLTGKLANNATSQAATDSTPQTDEIVAVMPYLIRKRLWYRYILMPQMTMFGGIWLSDELYASPELQERLAKTAEKKLRGMKIAYYYQQYPAGNPMPYWFAKCGMKAEQRVTYRINDHTSIEETEETYSKNKKRQLQKAENLTIDYDMTAEEFYRFHTACMGERGQRLLYSREFLLVLERKSNRAGASQFIRVKDGEKTVAAAFVVWDKRCMYYLIPAYLPSAAKSGASARLADEAIRMAKQKELMFDFEGGNDSKGIANHYQQFGATATTYSSVSKLYRPSFALLLLFNKWREKWNFQLIKRFRSIV